MKCMHCYTPIVQIPQGDWLRAGFDPARVTVMDAVCDWGRFNIEHQPMPDLSEVSA